MTLTIMMIEYLGIFFTIILIHEIVHYTTAVLLGFKPKMRISVLGPSIIIPEYEEFSDYSEIRNKHLKKQYVLIAISPYLLVPVYVLFILNFSDNVVVKTSFTTIVLLHLYSFIYEFKQKNNLYTQIAGLIGVNLTLMFLTLL